MLFMDSKSETMYFHEEACILTKQERKVSKKLSREKYSKYAGQLSRRMLGSQES